MANSPSPASPQEISPAEFCDRIAVPQFSRDVYLEDDKGGLHIASELLRLDPEGAVALVCGKPPDRPLRLFESASRKSDNDFGRVPRMSHVATLAANNDGCGALAIALEERATEHKRARQDFEAQLKSGQVQLTDLRMGVRLGAELDIGGSGEERVAASLDLLGYCDAPIFKNEPLYVFPRRSSAPVARFEITQEERKQMQDVKDALIWMVIAI